MNMFDDADIRHQNSLSYHIKQESSIYENQLMYWVCRKIMEVFIDTALALPYWVNAADEHDYQWGW